MAALRKINGPGYLGAGPRDARPPGAKPGGPTSPQAVAAAYSSLTLFQFTTDQKAFR